MYGLTVFILSSCDYENRQREITFLASDELSCAGYLELTNREGKLLTTLWCCVGGKYHKVMRFYQLG